MSNLYDMERVAEQRRHEIDDELSRSLLLRQLLGDSPVPRRVSGPPLRVRFGLMLIRLGFRLAA